jgi:ethanolamine utilization protein EutL
MEAAVAALGRVGFEEVGGVPYLAHTVSSVGSYLAKEAGVRTGSAIAYLIAPPLESLYGLDAALKAADVELAAFFAPPTETNFSGGLLTGNQSACQTACEAFSNAVKELVKHPMEYGGM